MNLSIPTNWQPGLLGGINKAKVIEIYGKLDKDPVGGGRPSYILPYLDKSRVREHVSEVHKHGLKFNYLLNATCLGNSEWSANWQKRTRSLLDWLGSIGVDAVTVGIPYLLELVKKCYPALQAKVSVCAQVSNSFQAKYWEDLGADEISLAPWSLNRDFEFLSRIRGAVKCRLQIYANTRCLSGCPFVQHHYSSISHSSASNGARNEFFIDYCRYSCAFLALSEPWRIIASSWVRPEDLHYYEEAGINSVKLSDRSMETEHIRRIVEAYTAERYDGNLMDLFTSPSKSLGNHKKYTWKKIRFFFHPFKVYLFRLYRLLSLIPEHDPTVLDNRELKGFIQFFIEKRCRRDSCRECGYCRGVAERALHIPQNYRDRMLGIYKELLEGACGGSLFKIKGAKGPRALNSGRRA